MFLHHRKGVELFCRIFLRGAFARITVSSCEYYNFIIYSLSYKQKCLRFFGKFFTKTNDSPSHSSVMCSILASRRFAIIATSTRYFRRLPAVASSSFLRVISLGILIFVIRLFQSHLCHVGNANFVKWGLSKLIE